MRLIRRADYRAFSWKNGGGITHEIAIAPEGAGFDDFIWRLSMAEVAADGPFSVFGGIDRTLTLIEGAGIALEFQGGGTVRLNPGAPPLSFPGEAAVTGRLVAGPIIDLNVMTRRGRASHHVGLLGAGEVVPEGVTALVCVSEVAEVGGVVLARGDCVMVEAGDVGVSVGRGDALRVVVAEADRPDTAALRGDIREI